MLFVNVFLGIPESHFYLFQATISALQQQPVVNAVIDGDDIIYRDYIDISIAVGTPKVCLLLSHIELSPSIWFDLFYVLVANT